MKRLLSLFLFVIASMYAAGPTASTTTPRTATSTRTPQSTSTPSAAAAKAPTVTLGFNAARAKGAPKPSQVLSTTKPPAGSGFIDQTTPQFANQKIRGMLWQYARQLHDSKANGKPSRAAIMGTLTQDQQTQLKTIYADRYTTYATDPKTGIITISHAADLMKDSNVLQ